jgi:hypothetical protein
MVLVLRRFLLAVGALSMLSLTACGLPNIWSNPEQNVAQPTNLPSGWDTFTSPSRRLSVAIPGSPTQVTKLEVRLPQQAQEPQPQRTESFEAFTFSNGDNYVFGYGDAASFLNLPPIALNAALNNEQTLGMIGNAVVTALPTTGCQVTQKQVTALPGGTNAFVFSGTCQGNKKLSGRVAPGNGTVKIGMIIGDVTHATTFFDSIRVAAPLQQVLQ